MDREAVLRDIDVNPSSYINLDTTLQEDPEIALRAVSGDGTLYSFLPEHLMADRTLALAALESRSGMEAFVAIKRIGIVYDRDMVLSAVIVSGLNLREAQDYASDPEIVLAAVRQNGAAFEYIDASVLEDPEIASQIRATAMASNPYMIQWMPPSYKDDKNLMLDLVSRHGDLLQYASFRLRQDQDIVQAAIKQEPSSIQYAFKATRDLFLPTILPDYPELEFLLDQ